MRNAALLLAVVLVAGRSGAEGVGTPKGASTAERLRASAGIARFAGGLLSIGGSTLRYLPAGARRWQTLHQVPGDNLYRIAVDEANGRVLAAWERDPVIHAFTPAKGQHRELPRPKAPSVSAHFVVDSLAFSSDGAEALIFMYGFEGPALVMYRAPLDGSREPTQALRIDKGQVIQTSGRGAVVALPRQPRQLCTRGDCLPIRAIVAYEVTRDGVDEKVLLSGDQVAMRSARRVRGSDDGRVVAIVELTRGGRGLLTSRSGDPGAAFQPLPDNPPANARPSYFLAGADLVEVSERTLDVELRRRALADLSRERVIRVEPPVNWKAGLFGYGARRDGSLWVHWGERLLLVDERGGLRGASLPLPGGREWAGVDLYVPEPEGLWLGIETGGGRDFERVAFATLDKRAGPWPGRSKGCAGLPPVKELMKWQVHSKPACSGGRPNPRAPRPVRPPVLLELPDGTKIIDDGAWGCRRVSFDPCTSK